MTQKDKNILLEIKNNLEKDFRIKSSIHSKSDRDAFILKIAARNAINIFKKEINFRNPTKKEKFNKLVNEIPYKQPRKIKL